MKEYEVTFVAYATTPQANNLHRVSATKVDVTSEGRINFYQGLEIVASFPAAITIYRLNQ